MATCGTDQAYYDAGTRMGLDGCALRVRDKANEFVVDYVLDTTMSVKAEPPRGDLAALPAAHPLRQALDQRNLRTWDGYGPNMRAIESDTQMRHGSALTHGREKVQLAKRVFYAGPDLRRGVIAADAESKLLSGAHDSRTMAPCDGHLAERDYDRFDPVLARAPVAVEHVVPPWVNGGAMSRDVARSDEFLNSIGYQWDGKAWRRGG